MADKPKPVNGVFNEMLLTLQARIEELEKLGRQNHQDWVLIHTIFETASIFDANPLTMLTEIRDIVRKHIEASPVLYHNKSDDILRNEVNENFGAAEKRKYDDRNGE